MLEHRANQADPGVRGRVKRLGWRQGQAGENRLGSEFGSYSMCDRKLLLDSKRLGNLVLVHSH